MLKKINNNLMLDEYEISVLKRYDIDVSKCSSLREVSLLVERFMNNF